MPFNLPEVVEGLRELTAMMEPDDDFQILVAAEKFMNAREEERGAQLKEAKDKLRELSKVRDAARKGSKRPLTAPSAEKHAETIKALDNERLTLVKTIRERESELAHMDEDFRRVRDDVTSLEETDEADEHLVDGTGLRLELIKSLGFEPVVREDGRVMKILVRSHTGDVHAVDLSTIPEDEISQVLWKLLAF